MLEHSSDPLMIRSHHNSSRDEVGLCSRFDRGKLWHVISKAELDFIGHERHTYIKKKRKETWKLNKDTKYTIICMILITWKPTVAIRLD